MGSSLTVCASSHRPSQPFGATWATTRTILPSSPCLSLGAQVKGGKVYGRWPGLSNEQLNEGRDLAVTTDFRQVLGEAVTKSIGAKNLDLVFPGAQLRQDRFLRIV